VIEAFSVVEYLVALVAFHLVFFFTPPIWTETPLTDHGAFQSMVNIFFIIINVAFDAICLRFFISLEENSRVF
jgi:hypothetical protein